MATVGCYHEPQSDSGAGKDYRDQIAEMLFQRLFKGGHYVLKEEF